jgi:hypothetical protein
MYGILIIGGKDDNDNYSRRTLMFENYQKFKEKASMTASRAFFSTVCSKSQRRVYALGGDNGHEDLN